MNYSELSSTDQSQLINVINNNYGFEPGMLDLIIESTSIKGSSFVSIPNYKSEKSDKKEVANHIININCNYDNMIEKDSIKLSMLDVSTIDVDRFAYNTIDYSSFGDIDTYKKAVKDALHDALSELQTPKKEGRISNDIYFNKALVYNTTSGKLSVVGVEIIKKVVEPSTEPIKLVKSAPKTIGKKLINRQINSRTDDMRRFIIDNFKSITLKGKTIEFA